MLHEKRIIVLGAVLLGMAWGSSGVAQNETPLEKIENSAENRPLQSLASSASRARAVAFKPRPPREILNFSGQPAGPDEVDRSINARATQDAEGTGPIAMGAAFPGASTEDNVAVLGFTVAPPDPDMDVGPNHIVQMINLVTTIYDKSGNFIEEPFPSDAFWVGIGGNCETNNQGDPIVLYDEQADRWLVSQFAFPGSFASFSQCVAISQTGDPTGGYNRYEFSFDEFGFNDYPKHGVTSDSITMIANLFEASTFRFSGSFLGVLDKEAMYAGDPADLIGFDIGAQEFGFVAGDLDGPGTAPNLFATAMSQPDLFDIWEISVDWAKGDASADRIASIPITPFDSDLCSASREACIPQPDSGPKLEAISDRLMQRLQIRDFGSYRTMVSAHTVDVGNGRAGVRWYELREENDDWSLHQEGTFGPDDGENRWMPSVAMNAAGDIGIGYLLASENTFMSTAVAGQSAANSGSGLLDSEELICAPGSGVQTQTSRSGDYSATVVDPGTDTFWHNNEVVVETGSFNWATFICEFAVGRNVVDVLEVFQIKGSGAPSSFSGQVVTTESNVVTAVVPDGFFMQTPDARADGDVDTSDGIFVATDGAPAVSVGDLVDVTGEVVEAFGSTRFSNGPTVTVTGTAALPTAVLFDAAVPSPDPDTPSCAIEFECYEGMLITLPEAVVGQGSRSAGTETFAGVPIRAGNERAFREPGVDYPGLSGGIPVWDGNPENFELNPAALGITEMALFGGTRIQAEGVLAFNSGAYELWPTQLILGASGVAEAVPQVGQGQFAIGSINLLRLFNATDDSGSDDFVEVPAVYAERLGRFAGHIVEQMRAPAIVGVQEVENLQTLQDLADEIADLDPTVTYSANLVEGNDVGGIDVGYLIRSDVTTQRIEQLGATETLAFDGSLLHERPPLLLEASIGDGADVLEFNLLLVHPRSLDDIETEPVKARRLAQAQSIGQMVQDLQTAEPVQPTIVLGGFNAFEFSDGYVDVVGQIAGTAVEAESEFWEAPLTSPSLEISTLSLPSDQRYSFVAQGNAQTLDHALFSRVAMEHVVSTAYTRGNADAPEEFIDNPPTGEEGLGITDHDSLVVTLSIISELLFTDGFEPTP